jgi:uroporphyrinogen III methyltransferase/synthase
LIFSSVNGVRFFFDRLLSMGKDGRALAGKSIAAIGPKTAEAVREFGLIPDLVPGDYKAEGLLEVFPEGREYRILFPRARVAREVLPETLRQRGCRVDVIPVYETVMESPDPSVVEEIIRGKVDMITFTASSTVRNFVEILGGPEKVRVIPPTVRIASIGPVTSSTLREAGLPVDTEAPVYTIEALVDTIKELMREGA